MARNRKRAKQRRDPREPRAGAPADTRRAERATGEAGGAAASDPFDHGSAEIDLAEAQLAVGRPDLSESELDAPNGGLEGGAGLDELEDPASRTAGGAERRGRGGPDAAGDGADLPARRRGAEGNRVASFVRGSWGELQRVQWPDRRQTFQATGIVLVFVIVAGSYLGLVDAIVSRLVDAIL